MSNTYSQKIAYNTAVQISGKIVTTILSLILIAYLTRYLGVFGFGQYTTVFVYLSFLGVIADFGFFSILVRDISAHPENERAIANNLLTFRTVFALIIYLIGIGIAYLMPYAPVIKIGIILISLSSFFGTLNSSLVGIFQARHKMDRSVITDVVGRAVILGISIYLIKHNATLNLIFWATIIGNFINLLLSWLLTLSFIKLAPSFNFKIWKNIFVSAWPLGLAAMFGIIYFKIDSVMLSIFRGSTDVGIYGAPYKILEILLFVPGIFMGNVLPIFSRLIYENNPKLSNAVQKSFDFLVISGIGILCGGLALSTQIIRFVAGQAFVTASTMTFWGHAITAPILFQILLLAMAISYVSYLFNPLIVAHNHQKALIWPAVFATILNIGLNLILIPRWGYLAAAATTFITELFILIYLGTITSRLLTHRLKIINLLKSIIAGIIMIIILVLLENFNLFLLIFVGAGVYLALLIIFRVLTREWVRTLL